MSCNQWVTIRWLFLRAATIACSASATVRRNVACSHWTTARCPFRHAKRSVRLSIDRASSAVRAKVACSLHLNRLLTPLNPLKPPRVVSFKVHRLRHHHHRPGVDNRSGRGTCCIVPHPLRSRDIVGRAHTAVPLCPVLWCGCIAALLIFPLLTEHMRHPAHRYGAVCVGYEGHYDVPAIEWENWGANH